MTEDACRTAAAAAGKPAGSWPFPFVQTSAYFPRGCYSSTRTNSAYFNPDAVGAGNSNAQLLCAATGAPIA